MSDFVKVGTLKDFPDNRTSGVKVDDEDVCITHLNGQLYAFEDSCTHAAALLSGANIVEGQVACPLHGAKFDCTTGDAKTMPATEPLKKHEIKVEGEDVFIKLTD